ncbi:MAG: hypothetical protein ACFBSF_14545 [Leptolyngbyaceae cyanobacterium]
MKSPVPNAAGRMGLFRILYSLFSLWLCSYLHYGEMSLIPAEQWEPTLLLAWLNHPPYTVIPICEALLAAALILLLVGYQTRVATFMIFLLGVCLTAIRIGLFMADHLFMIQYFYIPLFMIFSCWGDTYSIDSILRERQGKFIPQIRDPSWRYFWPSKGLLVIYALLMFSSAYSKVLEWDWISNPNFVGNLIAIKTIGSYLDNGFPVNPISIWISQQPWLYIPIQYGTLIFETVSILILFSPVIRFLFFRIIPIFHFANTFLMGIPFATVIGIYLTFPDWQMIYERFYPKAWCFTWLKRLSSTTLISVAILGAAFVGSTWNILPLTRYIFSGFHLINFHMAWLVIFPFALAWGITSIYLESKRMLRL